MPKETVYGKESVFGPGSSAVSILDVRWNRSEFVEVGAGVVHAADHSPYVPTEDERPGSGGKPIQGSYMQLDRASINALIRHLRRARDQAFGRDE